MPRGVKTCPQCEKACGPRTYKCKECGHQFIIKGMTPPPSLSPRITLGSKIPGPPSLKPKAKPGDTCVVHKRYTGTNAPKTDCEACWRMYLRDRFEEKIRPLDESRTIVAADPIEIDRFLEQLKAARDQNRHSGGGYSAFFHTKSGEVIRFDVQVPIDLLPYSHKKET